MCKVLVCDDKQAEIDEMAGELRKIERSIGVEVSQKLDIISEHKLTAENVVLAVERHNPDIIIMDLCDATTVPQKRQWVGADIIRRLKEDKAKDMPIIIWTQMDLTPYRQATYGIRNGAIDIVFKPRRKEAEQVRADKYNDLYQRINAALEKSNRKKAERDAELARQERERITELDRQERERIREHKLKRTRIITTTCASVCIALASMATSFFQSSDGTFNRVALVVAFAMGGLAWLNLLVPSIIYKDSPKSD